MRRRQLFLIASTAMAAVAVSFVLVPAPSRGVLLALALAATAGAALLHHRFTSALEQQTAALRVAHQTLLAELEGLTSQLAGGLAGNREEISALLDERLLELVLRSQRTEALVQNLQTQCGEILGALKAPDVESRVSETLRRVKHLANAVKSTKEDVLAKVESVSTAARDESYIAELQAATKQLVTFQKRLSHVSNQAALLPGLDELLRRVKLLAAAHERHRSELKVRLEGLAGETFDVFRLGANLFDARSDLPAIGGWAATASTLSVIVAEIQRNPDLHHIVECGSGASTVWFAAAMKHRGRGHVYALEHDRQYLAVTQEYIRRNDLEAYVTLIYAPLVEQLIGDDSYQWYDLSTAPLPDRVDLLFVDGPPGTSGPKARYPAYPLLNAKLSNGAWVVLDDTVRSDEREIGDQWLALDSDSLRLTSFRTLPKSTVFRFHRGD